MSIEPGEIGVVVAILGLILGLKAKEDRDADHIEKTLLAVSKAAYATEKYERARDATDGSRTEQTEIEISEFWKAASVYIRRYDGDLADRLVIKGRYWMNPGYWSAGEIRSARIELSRVTAESDRMLKRG